jgi:Protein of unknown function (DUF2752)
MMNAAPRTRGPAAFVWVTVAILALGLIIFATLFHFNPAGQPFYPVCYFHLLTGLNCPGCGSLRAVHQLAHGHLAAGLRCNVLLVLSLPVLAFIGARRFLRRLAGNPPPRLVLRPAWVILFTAVLVIFGILRNLPFRPFTYLSPP